MVEMEKGVARYFRDELRKARAAALLDAEAFGVVIVVQEQLEGYLAKNNRTLGSLAGASALARKVPNAWRGYHVPFSRLTDLVRKARNAAVHEGALARHLTAHAIELSLVLEDALMNGADKVADFMVPSPVTASPWQPLSFIRQSMLVSSFSYLPVRMLDDGPWRLVSDHEIARYLRSATSKNRVDRLSQSLKAAVESGDESDKVRLTEPTRVCGPDAAISEVLPMDRGVPVLVVGHNPSELLGILTPFDLL